MPFLLQPLSWHKSWHETVTKLCWTAYHVAWLTCYVTRTSMQRMYVKKLAKSGKYGRWQCHQLVCCFWRQVGDVALQRVGINRQQRSLVADVDVVRRDSTSVRHRLLPGEVNRPRRRRRSNWTHRGRAAHRRLGPGYAAERTHAGRIHGLFTAHNQTSHELHCFDHSSASIATSLHHYSCTFYLHSNQWRKRPCANAKFCSSLLWLSAACNYCFQTFFSTVTQVGPGPARQNLWV